ncbi:hypothetical protein C8Q69DRAFT_453219 [Paecilomyces variotii]|uniref:C2H2-type domain-containing protein n=1 Tax=Byssochlamys spectabilis TaxID=264951 RepID=A0A443I7F3_BYSSP|nr:hypothetical protein C8Q69DRAFT_453219 [Paecilomyces variotii]KAJ9223909.1 hypothetical protein DTO169C6_3779 [Paecilomyces variotii]KAJ9264805.1 hypothetical protein DTO195F2_2256 [Paecilomyces variotii]KAJ9326729.1 hypothetical protein DTO027B3_2390 [Paecilomyces variotii]KAJ9337667.1 hypothetical protein DTO027B5_488 [Paecilomyces variotii]KAJ9356235.1 hypothetical protein DTO280E4_6061 [Paecilomyces variotii]
MSVVAVASESTSNGIQSPVQRERAGSGRPPISNVGVSTKKNRRSKKNISQRTPIASQAGSATSTTGQVQIPTVTADSSSPQQEGLVADQTKRKTEKSAICRICKRRFGNKAALKMHMRNVPGHLSQQQKTDTSQSSIAATAAGIMTMDISDGNRPAKAGAVNEPTSQRGKRAVVSTKKAINKAELHCDICKRDFSKENGLRMHIETSKEHKANLERQRSQVVTFPAPISQPPTFHGPTFSDTFAFLERAAESIGTTAAVVVDSDQQTDTQPLSINANDGIQGGWSDIPKDMWETVLELMRGKCHSVDQLEKDGYILRESTPEEMEGYWRCENCSGRRKIMEKRNFEKCKFHPAKRDYEKEKNKPYPKQRPYSCCKTREGGCTILPSHSYLPPEDRILFKFNDYAPAPPSSARHLTPACPAVVLDCEMVEVNHTTNEVARLCAVDFLTGSVLIDTYVMPTGKITDYRTQYSGVTPSLLSTMALRRRALNGWAAARAELFKFIDESTILIGQSLHHDLDVLRVVHFNVIDTAIITQMAVDKECNRRWGLKTLCGAFLEREIQNKKTGHDCLEDVFATREVLWWCLRFPDRLAVWAEEEREAMRKKKEEEKAKRAAEKKKKEEEEGEKMQK